MTALTLGLTELINFNFNHNVQETQPSRLPRFFVNETFSKSNRSKVEVFDHSDKDRTRRKTDIKGYELATKEKKI